MGTTNRPKLLVLGQIDQTQDAWSKVTDIADVVELNFKSREDLVSQCKSGSIEGVSVIYTTPESLSETGRFDEELLGALPNTTKFICHSGLTYDQIDIPACSARSILVSNVPTASADDTADLALWLLLGCFRNLVPETMSASRAVSLGHKPRGKTLGLIGADAVSRRLAVRANAALGMRVLYHTLERLDPEHENEFGDDVSYAKSLEELFRTSDASKTRHTVSASQLGLMKHNAVLVNVSSAELIDQPALVEALNNHRIAAAGIDSSNGLQADLQNHPRAIITPGMAARTEETQAAVHAWALSNVRKALAERKLKSVVPEQRHLESDS